MIEEKQIFLSYSHKNINLADEIDNALSIRGIKLTRDINEVKFSQSLKEFMRSIGHHDLVLILVSDQYLKSKACMFEVTELMKESNYKQRIIPIVNDDVDFDLEGIIYLKYWEEQRKVIEETIKEHHRKKVKPLEEYSDEIELIEYNIMEFIATIRDLKYIQFKELSRSYNNLYERIGLEIYKNEANYVNYDIINEEDVSFGLVRRYSLNILINKDYPKCNIKNTLKEIIFSLKKDNDVIWIFVYNKLDDISNVNWFCRSYWVSPYLDQKWRPTEIKSNDRIEDIEIEWNNEYEKYREVDKSNFGTKNEIIIWSDTLLEQVIPIAKTAIEKFTRFKNNEIDEKKFLEYMHQNRKTVQELYLRSGERKYPSYECREYIQQFDNLFAIIDNMFLINSKENMNTWPEKSRIIMMEQGKKRFYKVLEELNYERKKLN